MREITSHKVNPVNEQLKIEVLDPALNHGASDCYRISGFDTYRHPSTVFVATDVALVFQNGNPAEVGVNGITHEALLAILIDRIEAFQGGPFANVYNADALMMLKGAQNRLQDRTRERMARGVEGTHQK